ncbi:MAG: dihydrofolate reductase family protein, partial [Gemmatimonadaceae bacterium]
MAKVIAIMSMSLDGFVADSSDGVAEVFDWYYAGDVDVPTSRSDFTFHVSAASAEHLRALMSEVGAMLTGRRTFN